MFGNRLSGPYEQSHLEVEKERLLGIEFFSIYRKPDAFNDFLRSQPVRFRLPNQVFLSFRPNNRRYVVRIDEVCKGRH